MPEIVGGRLVVPEVLTVMENGGSEATPPLPSLTLMMMFEYVPTSALVGMSDNWHLVLLKTAHAGGFWIEQRRVSPFGSEIVAMKLYQTPTLAVVGGVPEIRGGELPPEVEPVTVIENAGSQAVDVPSVTPMRMFE